MVVPADGAFVAKDLECFLPLVEALRQKACDEMFTGSNGGRPIFGGV